MKFPKILGWLLLGALALAGVHTIQFGWEAGLKDLLWLVLGLGVGIIFGFFTARWR